MPGQYTEFNLEDGTLILVETPRVGGGDQLLGKDKDRPIFETAIAKIRPVADAVLNTLRDMNTPKEVEVEFGVALNAKGGVIFASAESEVNFKVRLMWENTKDGKG